MEHWKDITGYNGLYQVSDLGRVKSLRRVVKRGEHRKIVPEIILAIAISTSGYPVVTLSKNGINKKCKVSRLVGVAWVPNPFNLPEINHKFGIKIDSRACVLEWTDRSGNMKHAYRTGLRKKPTGYTRSMRLSKQNLHSEP